MAGAYFKGGKLVGAGGEGDTDTFLTQTFENASLSDFNQVGLILDPASPISGTTSAKFIHQAGVSQYLQETKAVPEKFRGSSMSVVVTSKSGASLGNVTILFRDETNNVAIQTTQQIPATSTIGIYQFGLKIPSTCLSFSYTITALPEAGSPVTYIDDVTIHNYWMGSSVQGQTLYQLEVPVMTEWTPYTPVMTNQGTASGTMVGFWRRVGDSAEINVTYLGSIAGSGASAVQISIPSNLNADATRTSNNNILGFASTYNLGGTTLFNTATVQVVSPNQLRIIKPGTGNTYTGADFTANCQLELKITIPIAGWNETEPKSFYSTDIIPAKAMASNTSIDVPTDISQSSYFANVGSFAVGVSISGVPTSSTGSGVYSYDSVTGIYTLLLDADVSLSFGIANSTTATEANIIVNGLQSGIASAGASAWATASFVGKLIKGSTFFFKSNSGTAQFQRISVMAEATIVSTKTWSATQSVITSTPDAYLLITAQKQMATTNTRILCYDTGSVLYNVGSAIKYEPDTVLGDRFTALLDGIYTINATISYTNSSAGLMVTLNQTDFTSDANNISKNQVIGNTYSSSSTINFDTQTSVTTFLKAGDVVRVSQSFGPSAINTSAGSSRAKFAMSYQGSTKQIQTVSDQKIPIPIHEVRLENASTRGTGAEVNTIAFTSMTKLVGDGLLVDSSNGTKIIVQKDGILNAAGSVFFSPTGYAYITKNQASSSATISEIMTGAGNNASAPVCNIAGSFRVVAGDVLRFYAPTAAPTSNAGTTITLTLQEQKVAVSVSNILPQFSDSDSAVRVDTANGYGSVNTLIRRFSNVAQNMGSDIVYSDSATLGASFTVMSDGIYSITYIDNWTSNANSYIGLSRNTTLPTTPIFSLANSERLALSYVTVATGDGTVSWTGPLSAGDIVRPHVGAALTVSGINRTSFTIARIGKPNVTAVNVTPFINVPQADYGDIRWSGWNGNSTGGYQLFDSTDKLNGNGIFVADNTDGNGIKFLKRAWITTSFMRNSAVLSNSVIDGNIHLDGVVIANNRAGNGGTGNTDGITATYSGIVEAGQVLKFSSTSTAPQYGDGYCKANVLASALSDQILTQPETFSSDTADFVYSTSYNVSTLKDAPIGTFVTYAFTVNTTNTKTQTAAPPNQTVTDMRNSGLLITSRPYNSASNDLTPAYFAIQIGKGMKGVRLRGYQSANKTGEGVDLGMWGSGTSGQFGLINVCDYDEVTGILILDAATVVSSTITSRAFWRSSGNTQTSCYITVNASKNPALTGLNTYSVFARAASTTGQSIPNSVTTTMVFDSADTYDTTNSLNTSTGVFTAPVSGYYKVSGAHLYANIAWPAGTFADIYIYKNNASYSNARYLVAAAVNTNVGMVISDELYLSKGDTVSLNLFHQRGGATPLYSGNNLWNYFSISKIG
jgi:hypothetical protein